MIADHLIRCATEEDRQNLLEQYGSSCSFACRVVLQPSIWNYDDPDNPEEVQPEVTATGYHVWISLNEISEDLKALPDDACRLIAHREAAIIGDSDFILYHAEDVGPEVLASATISPIPAGTNYPLGNYVPHEEVPME